MSDDTVERFHRLYYNRKLWLDTRWMGVPVAKTPMDLWVYQEIIHATYPDLIVETGSWYGGSALYMASLLDRVSDYGRVLSIDITEHPRPRFWRIDWLIGSSTARETIDYVRSRADRKRTMVVLDSDHHKRHVLKELDAYAPLVTPGCYLVVEDTNVNGRPVEPKHGAGPGEALDEWLPQHPEFERDERCERFMLTFQPGGWLKRREE